MTETLYTAYIEDSEQLHEFEDVRDAARLPNGKVQVITSEGARFGVPGGEIIRLRRTDQ